MKFWQTYKPYYKSNLKIALPLILSQIGQVVVGQADIIMVGHLNEPVYLSAASFANSVFIILLVLGIGIAYGATPLVAHAFVSKNRYASASLLRSSFVLNFITVCLLVLVFWVLSYFMQYMGQDPEVSRLAIPYYRILVISFIPFMLFLSFKQFSEGLGNTVISMLITLFSNGVNIAFNYFLIFGNAGFPELKLDGAGYATLISRVITPILFFIVYLYIGKLRYYLSLAARLKTNWKEILKLFKVGFPIAAQQALELSAFTLSVLMVGWIGVNPQAAHQIGIGLVGMTFMISSGIAGGTTIRISHQYGAKNYLGVRRAGIASLHIVILFMVFTALFFILFKDWLPTLYTNDQNVIGITSQLLIMAAIFQLFDGAQVVLIGALRGLADVNKAMFYAFIAYLMINIPLSYLLAFCFNLGILGVWIGFVFGLGSACFLFYRRFNRLSKWYINRGG